MSNNPFHPTFGDIPQIYIDNQRRVAKLVDKIKESDFARLIFITGIHGSGKTSFMTQVKQKLQEDQRCRCIDLVHDQSLLNSFISQLRGISQTKLQQLAGQLGLASSLRINFAKEILSANEAYNVIKPMMEKVKQNHQYVLVAIDEVDNSPVIRSFAQIFNELKRHNLPIFVLMTGLPDLVMDIQNEDKLTFLLRSEKEVMTPLENSDIIIAYQRVFHCTLEVAQAMAKNVKGYSYAFQLLGYCAYEEWEKSKAEFGEAQLAKAIDLYKMKLFDNAYNKIFNDLSEMDQKYLIAVLGNKALKEVAQKLHVNSSYASQYRRRALVRHLVRPATYGHVEYTLPFFKEFIQATQDPNSLYYYDISWN